MPTFTETKTCPECGKQIKLEIQPRFDEPDDITIDVYKEDEDEGR